MLRKTAWALAMTLKALPSGSFLERIVVERANDDLWFMGTTLFTFDIYQWMSNSNVVAE